MNEDTTKINDRYIWKKQFLIQLSKVMGQIATCHDGEMLADTVVQAICSLLQVESCSLAAWEVGVSSPYLWHHSRELTQKDFKGDLRECSFTRGVKAVENGFVVQAHVSHSGLSSGELEFMRTYGLKSVLIVPFSRGDFKGCITAFNVRNEKFFEEHDITLARMIADQVVAVLENIRLYHKEKAYSEALEAFFKSSINLTASLDTNQVLNSILKSAMGLFKDAEDAHIFLYENDVLKFGAANWADAENNQQFSEPRQNGMTYTVARSGQPVIVRDMRDHPLFIGADPSWRGSIIGLPLTFGERVIGVMNIAFKDARDYRDMELRLLRSLGDQAAIAIENARLHAIINQQAHTDALTGLPNRRAFDERLDEEIRRCKRYNHQFALVMLDINKFKRVNDTYGHPFGDIVLGKLADCLRHSVRDTDFIARYGGDEFVMLLLESGKLNAELILKNLKLEIEQCPIHTPDGSVEALYISAGFAIYPIDAVEEAQLVHLADERLYNDKKEFMEQI
jgi:diguanylate cyclase (GGDEF)-like protein